MSRRAGDPCHGPNAPCPGRAAGLDWWGRSVGPGLRRRIKPRVGPVDLDLRRRKNRQDWRNVNWLRLALEVRRRESQIFRGLLDVHSRYGLPDRRTAMRSVVSKAPAISLPPSPLR